MEAGGSQLEKDLSALLNLDKDLARYIVMIENRVNAVELKIDRTAKTFLPYFAL